MILKFVVGDGSVRIWKDYSAKGEQKLVTAFSSITGHIPSVRGVNAVVDWQQQSGYLVNIHSNQCFFKVFGAYALRLALGEGFSKMPPDSSLS